MRDFRKILITFTYFTNLFNYILLFLLKLIKGYFDYICNSISIVKSSKYWYIVGGKEKNAMHVTRKIYFFILYTCLLAASALVSASAAIDCAFSR